VVKREQISRGVGGEGGSRDNQGGPCSSVRGDWGWRLVEVRMEVIIIRSVCGVIQVLQVEKMLWVDKGVWLHVRETLLGGWKQEILVRLGIRVAGATRHLCSPQHGIRRLTTPMAPNSLIATSTAQQLCAHLQHLSNSLCMLSVRLGDWWCDGPRQ
jgi:hypothetical protein